MTALGALLLVLHLGRNRRLAFTAGRNPRTSWLARGFWILSGFIAFGCTQLALAALTPGWAGDRPALWRALEIVVVVLAAGTALYTGLLLRSMSSIPAWRPWPLPALFVVSALSGGTAALVLGAAAASLLGWSGSAAEKAVEAAGVLDAALLIGEMGALALYVAVLRRAGSTGAASARLLLRGAWWPAFWIIVVCAGLLAPLAIDVAVHAEGWAAPITAACAVLAGGFTLRLAVLSAGSKEAPPLRRLGEYRGSARRVVAAELQGAEPHGTGA